MICNWTSFSFFHSFQFQDFLLVAVEKSKPKASKRIVRSILTPRTFLDCTARARLNKKLFHFYSWFSWSKVQDYFPVGGRHPSEKCPSYSQQCSADKLWKVMTEPLIAPPHTPPHTHPPPHPPSSSPLTEERKLSAWMIYRDGMIMIMQLVTTS